MKSFFVESFSKRRKREQLYRRSLASTEKIIRHVSLMNNFQRSFHISWNARNDKEKELKILARLGERWAENHDSRSSNVYIYVYVSLNREEFCEKFHKKFRHSGREEKKNRVAIKSYYTNILSFRLANFPSIIHFSPLYLFLSRGKKKERGIKRNR